MQTEVDRSLLCTSKVSQAWHVLRPKSMTSTLFRGLMPESFFRPLACSHDNRTTDNINCVTFEPAHPCRCTERGSRTARESRRTRPVQQSAKKSTRRWKPTPHFTAIACTSRTHLPLEALGVDAEVAGRAAVAVVGGREAGELLHRPPRRRVIVARGGADAEEEREEGEARGGGRLRRHASFSAGCSCSAGFDGTDRGAATSWG